MPKQSIGDRLTEFLKYKQMTISKLAEALNHPRSEKLQRLVREADAQPSYDTIMEISNYFPDLNLEWWLKGIGSMLQKPGEQQYNDDAGLIAVMKSGLPDKEKTLLLIELVRKANAEIKRLHEELQTMAGLMKKSN